MKRKPLSRELNSVREKAMGRCRNRVFLTENSSAKVGWWNDLLELEDLVSVAEAKKKEVVRRNFVGLSSAHKHIQTFPMLLLPHCCHLLCMTSPDLHKPGPLHTVHLRPRLTQINGLPSSFGFSVSVLSWFSPYFFDILPCLRCHMRHLFSKA